MLRAATIAERSGARRVSDSRQAPFGTRVGVGMLYPMDARKRAAAAVRAIRSEEEIAAHARKKAGKHIDATIASSDAMVERGRSAEKIAPTCYVLTEKTPRCQGGPNRHRIPVIRIR